jgi:dCMP deaminase
MDWDEYFMSMVFLVAMKSKDQNTKGGAIIVGPDNEIRSTGYNSFPRGLNDNIPERQERPEKYYWFAHAEENAILNAARIGVSVKNCKMYTHGMPCMNCARMIVQSGINEIIISKKWCEDNYGVWEDHAKRTKILFQECGVNIRFYDGHIIDKIVCKKDKKEFDLNN